MEEVIKIEGGHRLHGSVRISGSKNATVALIPAAVLAHAGELARIGVSCPRATALVNRLRAAGVCGGRTARTVREACDAVKEAAA